MEMTRMQGEKLVTVREAAILLGVSKPTIYSRYRNDFLTIDGLKYIEYNKLLAEKGQEEAETQSKKIYTVKEASEMIGKNSSIFYHKYADKLFEVDGLKMISAECLEEVKADVERRGEEEGRHSTSLRGALIEKGKMVAEKNRQLIEKDGQLAEMEKKLAAKDEQIATLIEMLKTRKS